MFVRAAATLDTKQKAATVLKGGGGKSGKKPPDRGVVSNTVLQISQTVSESFFFFFSTKKVYLFLVSEQWWPISQVENLITKTEDQIHVGIIGMLTGTTGTACKYSKVLVHIKKQALILRMYVLGGLEIRDQRSESCIFSGLRHGWHNIRHRSPRTTRNGGAVHGEINSGFLPVVLALPCIHIFLLLSCQNIRTTIRPTVRPEHRLQNSQDHHLVSPALDLHSPHYSRETLETANRRVWTLVCFGIFTLGQSNRSNHKDPLERDQDTKYGFFSVTLASSLSVSPPLHGYHRGKTIAIHATRSDDGGGDGDDDFPAQDPPAPGT